MDADAGSGSSSSSAPLFRRRGKPNRGARISDAVSAASTSTHPDDPAAADAVSSAKDSQDQRAAEDEVSVQDLIALRSLARRPTGIELQRLNQAQRSNKRQSTAAQLEARQTKRDGLASNRTADADADKTEHEDGSKPARLVRKNNFQGETGTVDVDKHMMAYIEDEMRRRTGTQADAAVDPAAIVKAAGDPQDALYAVAEKYRELQRSIRPEQTQDEREGNVALSSAMLTSIPEVDLGIDARMANIQQTEHAKRNFYHRTSDSHSANALAPDDAYASARFHRPKPRQSNLESTHDRPSHTTQEGAGQHRPERRQTATDQLVLDRFKKRQRTFR